MLLLGLLDLGLVMRMREIWNVVFTVTIITWAFKFFRTVPMVRWDVLLVGNI